MKLILIGAAVVTALIGYLLVKRKSGSEYDNTNLSLQPKPVDHHLTDVFANAKKQIPEE